MGEHRFSDGADGSAVRARFDLVPDLREISPAVEQAVRAATAPHNHAACEGIDALRLALTEALNNVVEHARHPSDRPICVSVCEAGDRLQICIEDEGVPLPLSLLEPAPEPEPLVEDGELALVELKEGGWGWMLIHASTVAVSYWRAGGQNRLCLEFLVDALRPGAAEVASLARAGGA
ncbi:MAG: ATP-binding protein [Pseudomonadota bacterium]